MKNRVLALSGLVVLMGVGAGYTLQAQTTPPVTPTPPHAGRLERHPEIRKAMKALTNAETDLKKAEHDFAGHREKALDLTQQALAECKLALQNAK